MKKLHIAVILMLTVCAAVCIFSACTIESSYIDAIKNKMADDPGGGGNGDGTVTYTVTYSGNGSTGGDVPADSTEYAEGDTVTVLPKPDALVLEHSLQQTTDIVSFVFEGWNTQDSGYGTNYDGNETFEMGTEDVVLYANWTAVGAIGPGGGRIFYDKGSVSSEWRFMEAAPEDQDWYIQWDDSVTVQEIMPVNGSSGTAVATDIGTGKENTEAIVSQLDTGTYAARVCYDLTVEHDWFLPSREELTIMYENLNSYGGWATHYWSSTESTSTGAYGVRFNWGYQSGDFFTTSKGNKTFSLDNDSDIYVRAARRFY